MSNQIVISSGAKVRNLSGVLTGTSGIVNSLGINVPDGIPQLDGSGKILVSQLPNSVMEYKGTWNAATNTPTLANGTGNAGDVYLCNVAGTTDFGAGPITFAVGDQVLYSGTTWEKASGATGTVTSVAVTESGDALTITGSPITTSGTINIGFAGTSGQYINGAGGLTTFPDLSGYVTLTTAQTISGLKTFSNPITISTASYLTSRLKLNNTELAGNNWSISSGNANNSTNNALFTIINETSSTNTFVLSPTGKLAIGGDLGTTNPADDLGIFSTNTNLKIFDITGNGSALNLQATNTSAFISAAYFTTAIPLVLRTGNTDRLTIAANGNSTFANDLTINGSTTGTTGSFASSGSGNTFSIDHSSGSGIALNITKAGNGEGIYVNKTSGSGNAATIIGTLNATTLVKDGGTSSQFLMADGSVNTSVLPSGAYLPLSGGTLTGALSGTSATFSDVVNLASTGNQTKLSWLGYNSAYTKITSDVGFDATYNGTYITNNTNAAGNAQGNTAIPSWALELGGGDSFKIKRSAAGSFSFSTLFNIASSGAATFSSSVTAGDFLRVNGDTIRIKNNASNLSYLRVEENASAAAFTYLSMDGRSSGYFAISTNDTERMRITSSGNVSIGTSNSSVRFNIQASANYETATLGTATGTMGYLSANGLYGMYIGIGNSGNTWLQSQRNDGVTHAYSLLLNPQGGNVGIGTTAPDCLLQARGTDSLSANTRYLKTHIGGAGTWGSNSSEELGIGYSGIRSIYTSGDNWDLAFSAGTSTTFAAGTQPERMRITASGNVGIGTNSPTGKLQVYNASGPSLVFNQTYTGVSSVWNASDGGLTFFGNISSHPLAFITNDTERMRINAAGYVKMSNNGSYINASGSFYEMLASANDTDLLYMRHSGTLPYGYELQFSNASPNNTSNWFSYYYDNANVRFSVRSNGGIANYQANDSNLSDERTKKDITPLDSYWDKFKAIEIVKFKYKDQTHDDFNIGVIAQQVEAVAPEFVDIDGWDNKPKFDEDGNEIISNEEPLKSIYTADLHHATIKVLQEAMAKIEVLEAKIKQLENK